MKLSIEKGRVSQLFTSAATWLQEATISEVENSTRPLGDLLRILLGIWICEQASPCPQTSSALGATISRVENQLREEAVAEYFDPFKYDTKLLLLCHHILSVDHRTPYGIATFALRVASELRRLPVVPLRFIGEALLLSQLGYIECPSTTTLHIEDAGGGAFQLLRASDDQLRTVCNNVAAATQFGRRPLQADTSVCSYLDSILPIILLQSLRANRLEISAMLLRTSRYLCLSKVRAIRLAIQFLMNQQQKDGRFGYFAIEVDEISKVRDSATFDAISELYLPITVSCLWSLAEVLMPKFNLFLFSAK